MTIVRYFHKCSSTSLQPVNVLKQLQSVVKDNICIDSLETEVCLHVEVKHGKGGVTYQNKIYIYIIM